MSRSLIKITRIFSSIVKTRVKTFLFCFNLDFGLFVTCLHTSFMGFILLLTYSTRPDELAFDLVLLPNDVTLVAGIFGTMLMVLGMCLFMAAFSPKTGLLDAYIINMQLLQLVYPTTISYVYVRTYINTEKYFQNFATEKQTTFHIIIYSILLFAIVTYVLFFYYIVVVLSYKDQYLLKLKKLKSRATIAEPGPSSH